MSSPNTSEKSVYLDREEHVHKGELGAKRVVVSYYDSATDSLIPVNNTNPLPTSSEGVSTEETLVTLTETLQELAHRFEGGQGEQRAIARDNFDRLRVVLDSVSASYMLGLYSGNANTYPTWYSTGSPNAMDGRELQEEQSIIAAQQARIGRWSFS